MFQKLSNLLQQAFRAEGIDPSLAVVIASEKTELADFQCNGVRAAAGRARVDPQELATRVIARINEPGINLSVAGPGFINIKLDPEVIEKLLRRATLLPQEAGRVVLDFGGPNIAKAMHVGHLRSLVIGDSLQRILRFAGYEVISDIHLGDWGLQMGLLLAYLENTPLYDIDMEMLEEAYPKASAMAKEDEVFRLKAQSFTQRLQSGDEELSKRWRRFVFVTLKTVERELSALNVIFTSYNGESDVQELIPGMISEFIEKGLAEEDQGALVVRVGDPPLILRKSDGAALYATTDLATIKHRMDKWAPDRIIYITDERQQLHFKQVFEAAERVGYMTKDRLEHIWFGTVNDTTGKPLKTRAGGVPKLHDLIQEAIEKAREKNEESAVAVAMAALKFADLQNPRMGAYVFDLDRFLSFEGKTGPYLLYQAVRIKSILNKAVKATQIELDTEQARQIGLKLVFGFPQAIDKAVKKLSPKEVADHAYDLAQSFSKYYANHTIADDGARVALAKRVLAQLETCLDLLGIEVPERM